MSAPLPPCACRHFHGLHIPAAARAGRCTGAGCDCQAYTRPTRLPDEHLRPEEIDAGSDAQAPAMADLAVPERSGRAGVGAAVSEYNPTDDELRAIAADSAPFAIYEDVATLARLVLREREELAKARTRLEIEQRMPEVEPLLRWKAEATTALAGWEGVWRELGEPGPLGIFKWEACVAEIRSHVRRVETAERKVAEFLADRDRWFAKARQAEAALARVEAACAAEEDPHLPVRVLPLGTVAIRTVRAAMAGDGEEAPRG